MAEVRFTSSIDDKKLARLSKKLSAYYPHEVHQIARGVSVNFESGSASFNDGETILRRSNADQTEIALLRPNGVSISRLAPYTQWEDLAHRIKRDIGIILAEKPHRKVSRVGLRYINRIDIPSENERVEYEDYLNLYVQIPKIIPSIGEHALVFSTIHDGFAVRVQSGSSESPVPGALAFVLDLDVFTIETLSSDLHDILNTLDRMRSVKNDLFEAFITDKAREMFNNG